MVLFPKRNNTPNQLTSWLSQPKVSGKENLDQDLALALEKSRKEFLMQKNAAPIDDDDFQPIERKRIIPLRERQKRLRRQSSELSSSSTRSTQIKREQPDDEEEVLTDFNDAVKDVVKKETVEEEEEEEIVNFDDDDDGLEPVVKKERSPEDDEEEVLDFNDFLSQQEPVIKQEKPSVHNNAQDPIYDIMDSIVDNDDDDDDDDDDDIEDLTNWTPSSQPPQIFTPSPSPPPREPTPPPRNKGKHRATPNYMPTPVAQLNIPKRKRHANQDPQCPLCLKRFAADVIEQHASECLGATSSSTQSTRQSLIDEQFPTIHRQDDDETPRRRRRQRRRTPSPLPDETVSDIEGFSDDNNEMDNQDFRTCPLCGDWVPRYLLQDHVNAEMDRNDQNSSAEPRSSSTMGDLRDSFDVVHVSDDDDDDIVDLSNQELDDGYLSPLEGFVNINDRPEQFQQYFNQGLRQGSSSSPSRQRRGSSSRGRRQETPQQAARRRAKFAKRNARGSYKKRAASTSKKYKKKAE
ncbi:hypothetical protein BJV82DRAFT_156223 [Fennellomyces sp. T-0311]|nr:hypothetical protein BJV82DRAFT_156223 [Fennellomyces sp. T-0311]